MIRRHAPRFMWLCELILAESWLHAHLTMATLSYVTIATPLPSIINTVSAFMRAMQRNGNFSLLKDRRGPRNQWPKDRPSFCRFVLYKENKDTAYAISTLARMLKVSNAICLHEHIERVSRFHTRHSPLRAQKIAARAQRSTSPRSMLPRNVWPR